jgi:hypothetical protein
MSSFLSEKEVEAEIDFSRARPRAASTGDKLTGHVSSLI